MVIGALLCVGAVNAQSHKQTHAASPSSQFQIVPFDLNQSSIPALFFGHAAPSVFSALAARSSQFTKSDFETSSAYADRLVAFSTVPFFHGMRPIDSFAFVVIPVVAYNADTGKLAVSTGFEWSTTTTPAGTYVGSNSFGVKRTIRRVVQSTYNISVDSPDWFKVYYSPADSLGSHSEFTLTMDGDIARRLSRTLRVLLIGSLAPPFVKHEQFRGEPTISDPEDLLNIQQTLYISLSAIWLYDGLSGEVIQRYDRQKLEQDWPIRAEVLAKNESDFMHLHVLSDGHTPKSTPYMTREHAFYIAKSSMEFKLDFIAPGTPPISVKMNGQEQKWECKQRPTASYFQDCSIMLITH
jgi:hypothetical protein